LQQSAAAAAAAGSDAVIIVPEECDQLNETILNLNFRKTTCQNLGAYKIK